MSPWECMALIVLAGGIGGVVNALTSDNGFPFPKLREGIWCPGFLGNVLIGAFSAFASWSFYGSGAGVELARSTAGQRGTISLTFSALAGAAMVGVAGCRWLTNEVDKRVLRQSATVAAAAVLPPKECEKLNQKTPIEILSTVTQATADAA